MRSERLAWLRSQGLGLLCGQAAVLLLGTGSFVLVATRDGASAGVHLDDLRAFFREPSYVHAWLYLLAGVLGLYALNTALCTWDSVVSKWRRGIRELTAYAPAVIHVAFLLALVAHLAGGLFNEDPPPVVLTPSQWTDVAPGRQARLASLSAEELPDGRPRRLDAELELREGGRTWREPFGYNAPVSRGLGAELLLLEKAGQLPGALRFESGGEACSAPEGGTCSAGGVQIHVVSLRAEGHWGIRPAAILEVSDAQAGARRLMLLEGTSQAISEGRELRFASIEAEQAVLVRRRIAPGNPWAFAAALTLALGLALMGRRWLWG